MEYTLPEVWFQCVDKEVIGTGAYGTVHKVKDPDHNISAVKVLNIPATDEEAQAIKNEMKDPRLVREYFTNLIGDFMREIQIMESLKDTTNVVQLKSHYLESNAVDEKWTIYIQMEVLTSLTQYCSTHEMTEDEVVQLGIDVLKAIRDCNKKDIIHRDIKPDNIMVAKDGTFKLGDFGIARYEEKMDKTLTIRGTFSYMAPEIFHSESYGKTVDLYSLGLVMYRLMNKNRDPFVSTTKKLIYFKDKEKALKQRMEGQEIPPPANASEELAEIILRACAYNVEDRYQSAEDMLRDLMDLQKGVYIIGRSYADRSTVRRIRLAVRKSRYEILTMMFFILCLIGAAGYTHNYRPGANVKEWNPEPLIIDRKTREEIINEVEIWDDIVWSSMRHNDSEDFLNNFSDYTPDQFAQLYREHYLLENSKKDLGEKYDRYLKDYQENNKTYYHIIGQEGDNYYVEAVRYYIDADTYRDSRMKKEIKEYFAGNLLQSSMFYWIDYRDKDDPDVDLVMVRKDDSDSYHSYDTFINDIITPFDSLSYMRTDNGDHKTYDEYGSYNYLYLEPEFVYKNFFRVNLIDQFLDEENNRISFIISVKNGVDKDVTIRDINFEYDLGTESEEFPGERENSDVNITADAESSACFILTYKIHGTGNIDIDRYRKGYVSTFDYHTDLKGVRNDEQ